MSSGKALFFPASDRGEKALHLSLLLLCLAPVASSFLLTTDGLLSMIRLPHGAITLRSVCLFRLVTGYHCPVCGMTRSFIYMSRLEPGKAFLMNSAGPALYLLCLFEIPYRSARLLLGRIPMRRFLRVVEFTLLTAACALDAWFFISQFFRAA